MLQELIGIELSAKVKVVLLKKKVSENAFNSLRTMFHARNNLKKIKNVNNCTEAIIHYTNKKVTYKTLILIG